MKTVENKQTQLKLTEETNITYADLIAAVINKPVKESVTLNDMRRDLRILDMAEKANKESMAEMSLSVEDVTYLKEQVKESKWVVRHVDILDFADYIDSL